MTDLRGAKFSSFSQVFHWAREWARSHSFWYYSVRTGCCADEVMQSFGCRYDLERFGCIPQEDPRQADLLIVSGAISKKAVPKMRELYEQMVPPRAVLAVGACACSGGAFSSRTSYASVDGLAEAIPVDVYVPGCPPRPEAIMNGLLVLQEKMRERR